MVLRHSRWGTAANDNLHTDADVAESAPCTVIDILQAGILGILRLAAVSAHSGTVRVDYQVVAHVLVVHSRFVSIFLSNGFRMSTCLNDPESSSLD